MVCAKAKTPDFIIVFKNTFINDNAFLLYSSQKEKKKEIMASHPAS